MTRQVKCRRISAEPTAVFFKPQGVRMKDVETVILALDEFEAFRLANLEGLYHEQAAEKMNVSRQTFGNIVKSAGQKIADALVNGKALLIEGGVVSFSKREETRIFTCIDCEEKFEVPFGQRRPETCPKCGSEKIHRI